MAEYETVEIDLGGLTKTALIAIICKSADADVSVNQVFEWMLKSAADDLLGQYYWGA